MSDLSRFQAQLDTLLALAQEHASAASEEFNTQMEASRRIAQAARMVRSCNHAVLVSLINLFASDTNTHDVTHEAAHHQDVDEQARAFELAGQIADALCPES